MHGSTKGRMRHSLRIVCEPIMDTTNSKKEFFGALDNGWDCELFHMVSF